MSALKGPADASNYRVKVGRFGTRWYTDPLPGCDIAEASDWHGPSVSATKPPFANKYVPMKTIANMSDAEWGRLAKLTATDRYDAVKTADRRAGRINMDRGTLVHEWAEDLIAGRPIVEQPIGVDPDVLEQARRFRPALESFFDTYQPEPIAVECVCLQRTLNGVGYGGTADLFARIEGDVWAVDWKSRTSDHGAYLEEAAQGGAYVGADYMIVDDGGTPRRVAMPEVAGVLIVSITDDSFQAFPIDAAGAVEAYHEMHRWWLAQRNVVDRKVIGRPWAPKAVEWVEKPRSEQEQATDEQFVFTDKPAHSTRREQLLARFHAMQRADRERFIALKVNPDDLDAVEQALNKVDPFARVAEPPPVEPSVVPVAAPELDEGRPATNDERETLKAAWLLLEPDQAAWVKQVVQHVGNLSVDQRPVVRRTAIGCALVQLAAAGWHDDQLLDAVLGFAGVPDLATADGLHVTALTGAVDALVDGRLTFAVPDGATDMQLIAA